MEHEICAWIFSTTVPEKFIIFRRTEWYIIININRSSYKVPTLLARF
jgi:hypothetical protein